MIFQCPVYNSAASRVDHATTQTLQESKQVAERTREGERAQSVGVHYGSLIDLGEADTRAFH